MVVKLFESVSWFNQAASKRKRFSILFPLNNWFSMQREITERNQLGFTTAPVF